MSLEMFWIGCGVLLAVGLLLGFAAWTAPTSDPMCLHCPHPLSEHVPDERSGYAGPLGAPLVCIFWREADETYCPCNSFEEAA